MRSLRLVVIPLVLIMIATTFAAHAGSPIVICGSGDNQDLLRRLGQAYEKTHPGITIAVPDSIGSSGGVKATAQGRCDLGRLARPLRDKEKRYNLRYQMFARSPVVFLVNASVEQVTSLTAQQVVNIFAGKISSWSEVGGDDRKIYVASREKGDSSRTVIENHLIDFALIDKPAGKIIYSTPETIDIVGSHADTISYGPLSAAKDQKDIRILAFEGIMPDTATITRKSYPLFSQYGLVWRQNARPEALAFVDFLASSEAAEIMLSFGTIPARGKN